MQKRNLKKNNYYFMKVAHQKISAVVKYLGMNRLEPFEELSFEFITYIDKPDKKILKKGRGLEKGEVISLVATKKNMRCIRELTKTENILYGK